MKTKITILLFIIFTLSLTSCDVLFGGNDEVSPEEALTAVFQTVEAALSLTPQPTSTSTSTATNTATATATFTPSATASSTIQVADSANEFTDGQASGCDNAAFAGDVTIPDGTQFDSETPFTKTWRLSNTGSCTWNSGYSVVFVSGEAMSGISPQALTFDTGPGSSREISIDLVAPKTPGTYTGYWRLKNPAGELFGHSFYVQIVVKGNSNTTPTATATGPTSTPSQTIAPGTGKADLSITSMAFDPSPERGKTFTVRVEVQNKGGTDAGSFVVEWWSDTNNDNADTKKVWNVSGLAAGTTKTLEHTCECYDNAGTYSSRALADATGTIDENDESNNDMTITVNVQ